VADQTGDGPELAAALAVPGLDAIVWNLSWDPNPGLEDLAALPVSVPPDVAVPVHVVNDFLRKEMGREERTVT
jgi:hypothetical protein